MCLMDLSEIFTDKGRTTIKVDYYILMHFICNANHWECTYAFVKRIINSRSKQG